jgi:aspartyl protease family protein
MKNTTNFIILILMLAALVALLFKHFPNALASDQAKLSIAFSLIVIISMISKIASHKIQFGALIRQLTGWVLISLLIITGYSYQYEIKQFGNRLSATVIPGYGQGNGDGSVTYYAGDNGHFAITALINMEARIQFLLDTGASLVSLTYEDAKSIGINVDDLNYNYALSTANGMSYGARVNLATMQVGPIILENVEAVVSKPESSDTSLLGMTFLSRLKQFAIKGNSLTLVN